MHEPERSVRLVDTTLRDGQMSLWATRMRTGMMLPVVERLDRAGFDAVELMSSSFFKKQVRDLREDPWERMRLVSRRMQTPLRLIKGRHIAAFQMSPPDVTRLWLERVAANGIRQVRISDPSNTVAELRGQVRLIRAAGMDPIVNLIFSISPRHTDQYYREKAQELASVNAMRLCLKDPGGLLTPERTRALAGVLLQSAAGTPVEIHTHCTTGLGPFNVLEALAAGIRIVNTAIPPLASGSSLPSVFRFAANARALGYRVDIDEEALRGVSDHLRAVAEREDLPSGMPAEYDADLLRHQVPGGMISNFRYQLRNAGMEQRLDEVLEEVQRVRADLGHPIMVTPYSQFVGSQAAINVVTGRRYEVVTDELIHYALGHWGAEEAQGVDADVKDRILGRRRAAELAAMQPEDGSVAELRRRLDLGPSVSDDEFLLCHLAGRADVRRLRAAPQDADYAVESPLLALLRAFASDGRHHRLQLQRGDLKVRAEKR